MKRDFIALEHLRKSEILHLLELTAAVKKDRALHKDLLKGKTLALLFQKPSNRTRVSFEVGIRQMGGHCLYLGPEEINLGKRESTADVAKTLSRYLDGIIARTHTHKDIVELAKHASIPIINGLSDLFHPCQTLADIFSIQEKFKTFKGITLAYVGDGNNVCHSLMLGCAKVGLSLNIATPKKYKPNATILKTARKLAKETGIKINLTTNPKAAVKKANVIYTDVWTSMGQEAQGRTRRKDFKKFQINAPLAGLADKNYVFMHCLPAHRGEEVTADVIDGPHSIIFDQAENRMHAQKAVLIFLMGADK